MVYEAVVENGREIVKARKVAVGGVYNNQIEILPEGSAVRPGSRIVTTIAERLTDGLPARITQDHPTKAITQTEAR
jgi:hypothetical protein